MHSEIVLSVENLVTEFKTSEGRVTAVDDVSFQIKQGKVLGIVGESGCGKSVTALSIMRLVPSPGGVISGGRVLFGGQDLLSLSDQSMRQIRGNKIAMIFQEPMTALNPVFTVGHQTGEILELHQKLRGRENRQRSVQLLKRVGIPRAEKVVDEYPHQLSGGMRQRVMIAMALSCNPQLLIADEPTTALDVTIQAQVLEMMKRLTADAKMAVMFITHDLGVIAEMAQEVLVMYAGRIVEKAPVADIFHRPAHPYTRGLMSSRPGLAARGSKLSCIKGMVPSLSQLPKQGCVFAPRCSEVIDVCWQQMPELLPAGREEHQVRCWVAQQKSGVYDGA